MNGVITVSYLSSESNDKKNQSYAPVDFEVI